MCATSKKNFLLVGEFTDFGWDSFINEILKPNGLVKIVQTEKEAEEDVSKKEFSLIIIDGSTIANPEQLVHQICARRPGNKVIVVSLSPTWKEARAVFLAGALDYLRWPLTINEFQTAVFTVFEDKPHATRDYTIRRQ